MGVLKLSFWVRDLEQQRSLRGFLKYCFPRRIYLHRSATLDFRFFVINTALSGIFLAPFLLSAAAQRCNEWWGLVQLLAPGLPLLFVRSYG